MSKRAGQVGSELHRAIQAVIDRGFQDPRLDGVLLTVTDVKVGQDIRNATIMVSVMPEDRESLAMHGLRAAAGFIRREAGKLMEIRRMPELAFKPDRAVRKQAEVLEAIARATAEREAVERQAAPREPDGEAPRQAQPGNSSLPSGWSRASGPGSGPSGA